MAVTLRSVYDLIDRASPELRRIRREANRTDAALASAGAEADEFGSRRRVAALRASTAAVKDLGGQSRTSAVMLGRMNAAGGRLHATLLGLRASTVGFGVALRALKIPLIVSGLVALHQGLVAVGAGTVALTTQLKALGAGIAPLTSLMVGLKVATGIGKLAFWDFDKAMKMSEAQLARVTPATRDLVTALKDLEERGKGMRSSVRGTLFPGLTESVRDLERALPTISRFAQAAGGRLGGLSAELSGRLTQRGVLHDIVSIADTGTLSFTRAARTATHLAMALKDVAIVGKPFTNWLTLAAVRASRLIAAQAKLARDTGRMGRYFEESQQTLRTLSATGMNFVRTLRNIGRAASPLGGRLLDDLEELSERWEQWTGSSAGQLRIRRFFDELEPTLHATAGLVGDIVAALGRLAINPDLAGMIESLRGAVGPIERIARAIAGEFGPGLGEGITQLARFGENLSGVVGPLSVLADTAFGLLGVFNDIVGTSPAVRDALASVFSVILISRFISHVREARNALLGLTAAEGAARSAGALSAIGVPLGRPGQRGGGGTPVGPQAIAGGAAAAVGAGFIGSRFGGLFNRGAATGAGAVAPSAGTFGFGRVLDPAAPAATASRGGRLGGMLGGAAGGVRAAGRALWPAALALGAFDFITAEGNVGQRAASALNSGLLGIPGLIAPSVFAPPPPPDPREQVGATVDRGPGAVLRRAAELRGDLRETEQYQQVQRTAGRGHGASRRVDATRHRLRGGARDRAQAELRGLAPYETQVRQQQGADIGAQIVEGFAVRRGAKGIASGRRGLMSDMREEIKRNGPQARIAMAGQVAPLIAELERGGKKSKKTAAQMRDGIIGAFASVGQRVRIVNGNILTGTRKEWSAISQAMTSRAEKARQEVTKSMTDIQRQAYGSLQAMGYSKSQARSIVRDLEGGSVGARRDAAQGPTGAGMRPSNNDKNYLRGRGDGMGDAWGADAHRRGVNPSGTPTRAAASAGAGSLMGAGAHLGPFAQLAAQYGLSVSSGLRPGSITSSGNLSHHASGNALDLAGSPAAMMAFAQAAASQYGSGLAELIYSPLGFSIKNGQRVAPYAVADHYDHVHIAATSSVGAGAGVPLGGMLGGGAVSLDAPKSGLGGFMGPLADSASKMYAAGLEQKINDALGGGIGGDGATLPAAIAGSTSPGTGTWAAQIAQVGLPAIFNAIVAAESGGNPMARNPSGASGLAQIMMPLHQGLVARAAAMLGRPANVFDPLVNLTTAKLLYDQSGTAPWTESQPVWGARQGDGPGFEGWFANGGIVTASEPTLLGIGDGPGKERAVIQPLRPGGGASGGRGGAVTLTKLADRIVIENHRPGDIKEQLRREVMQLLAELGDAAEKTPDVDDEVLFA